MTDYLANYNDPALLAAVMDVIAAMPDEHRHGAAAALDEGRISAALLDGTDTNGDPMHVLELSIIDGHGAHPFARLDAARFNLDGDG